MTTNTGFKKSIYLIYHHKRYCISQLNLASIITKNDRRIEGCSMKNTAMMYLELL
jgi:hypothetical protein